MYHLSVGQQYVAELDVQLGLRTLQRLQFLLHSLYIPLSLPVRCWMVGRTHLMYDAVHPQELLKLLGRILNTVIADEH